MNANSIRNLLGQLQDDPDRADAWSKLRAALGVNEEGTALALPKEMAGERAEIVALLEKARASHAGRREFEAVAALLDLEAMLARGTDAEAELVAQLAAVRDEEVLDDAGARAAYERLLELRPGDVKAEEFIETSDAKRAKWADIVAKYVDEAKAAGDAPFKASMLVGASEVAYRFGRPQLASGKRKKQLPALIDEVVSGLREAVTIDPKGTRAVKVLERVLRAEERWEDLAALLEQRAESAAARDDRAAGLLRLARVLHRKMNLLDRAQEIYAKVLSLQPGNSEATSALVDVYTHAERWDELVALYEAQLATLGRDGQAGTILQIAMVNWRMRRKPDAAEPYFERLRRLEPAHPGMLGFFREWCAAKGETARLTQILTEASRAMPDGPERVAVGSELAKLAEEGPNAAKAIENWRNLLRQDPTNKAARDALKRLYRQTGGWNALTDLLRNEAERLPQGDTEGRLTLLREIASVYRDSLKSDTALVTVLAQIVHLAPADLAALRELARAYETLGRWRDLLTTQSRLAELETDTNARVELHRAIARRWLEQFSNVQNALESYEKLADLAPDDAEAIAKLRELYTKRRAFKSLYDLLDRQSQRMPAGPERREVWLEMAKMAAERLDRGADAASLYRKLLQEDPSASGALDALEKQAERDKDYRTVAEVLERRVTAATDPAQKLAVLQKLGAVYTDRLDDVEGAKKAWRRVLDLQPGQPKALRVLRDAFVGQGDYDGLTELYESQGDFEGLAEVFSTSADRTTDVALKVELSYRAADVYVKRLRAPERAFRAYERILAARPTDLRAATALAPLYEKEEKWARLPPLYEVLLAQAEGEDAQLELLEKLVDVTGRQLSDRTGAFGYARRAYDIAAKKDPQAALTKFEAAARAADAWAELVNALEARLPRAKVGERRVLRAKIAEVQAREGQIDDAVQAYKALVEEDDGDDASLQALEQLLRGADRRDDLRWLFDLRVARSPEKQKIDVLTEWAALEEDVFQAPDQAVAIYRRILDVSPKHSDALRAVARLLRASGDLQGAVEILERDRDLREGADRAARDVEIAQLDLRLKRPEAALAAAKRALDVVKPRDGSLYHAAIGVVEELLTVGETRASAAAILDDAYGELAQLPRQAEVLEVRIATTAAREDRSVLYVRLAAVHEKLGALGTAFDVMARAARDYPTELPLWDRLTVLAQRTKRGAQFVAVIADVVPPTGETGLPAATELDLAERAATLYDEALGDQDRARPYHERVLARDPTNERAFTRLKQILTARERWEELEQLYEQVFAAATTTARKTELLNEIALVTEEIHGNKVKATRYYVRILELQPDHELSLRALDMLYAGQERWPELGKLLEYRVAQSSASEALVYKLRLGALRFSRLDDPKRALDELEDVLQADTDSREARDIVEKCLDVAFLRARAAVILERVYIARDDAPELARILEIRLETVTDVNERRELLRRIAELRDHRMHDDPGAFEAYARFVPITPADDEARKRLLEIAGRTGAHERTATVLLEAADAAEAPQPRADILNAVAAVYEGPLKDPARAEQIYRRVIQLGPEDAMLALPAARALERIYVAAGKSAELAEMLGLQVKLEESGDVRRDLLGRLGELCETVLSDAPAAIVAWRQRTDDDPADEQALEALDRLYQRTGEWRALVEVLRARERGAQEKDARKTFMVRAAAVLADKLSDVSEAILAYRAVLDDFGADTECLSALEALYALAERWPDLAEALEFHLSLVSTDAERLSLLARLGEVRLSKIADLPTALEAYSRALEIDGAHAPSREALEGLLGEPSVRREAAATLRPLYEKDGQHVRLLRTLEIEAEYADVPDAKLAVLAQAVMIAEGELHEPVRAWGYASRGVRDAAATDSLREWLAHVERLTEATADYASLTSLLKEIVRDVADGDLQQDVTLRIAVLARTKLADVATAREYYVKALEQRGDDRRALEALESIYEEAKDAPALLDILQKRAAAAPNDEERKSFLFKEARLSDETMKNPGAAIETYEAILELGLDDEAIAALERLYTDAERWGDLIALHEREIGAPRTADARKADLFYALGRVQEKRLANFEEAFAKYEEALGIDGNHAATVSALEALMGDRPHTARAAEMLEGVYLARLDWRRVMTALEARLGVSEDPEERRLLLKRLSKLHEEQGEDYRAALETTAKLLAEDVTDEETWAELERLARVANGEARLAEIFAAELDKVASDEPATAKLARRTGQLFEAQKDIDRALQYYRRAHAFAPEDSDGSFDAIDRLLREAKRPAERIALYRQSLDWREGSKARLATLHTIALIEETELGDDDKAIETFRAALEVEETDVHTLESLSRLYARRERWRELADLLRKRAEQSALPEDEGRFRLELGRLLEHRLSETASAIDEYHATTELTPPPAELGKQAVSALEAILARGEHRARLVELLRPIYEKLDDWKKLVSLNEERLVITEDARERVAIFRETAQLEETRGADKGKAFVAVRAAFVLDPDDGDTRAELDRLAEATKRWDDLADAYEQGIVKTEGVGHRELLASLARVHDRRRDDPRKALDAWNRLYREDESDITPLEEMDALATLLSDWKTQVWILAKKAALLPSDEDRASAWRRVGEVRRDMLDEMQGAIDAYEAALELEPESAFTLDNLIPLYEQRNDSVRLVDLYRRRVNLCGEDDQGLKFQLLVDAATHYETGLEDPREAITHLNEALSVRPGDLDVLKRLDALYTQERQWPELLDNLRQQFASMTDEGAKRFLKKRIGALLAGQLEDPKQALDAYRDVLEAEYDSDAASATRVLGERNEELRYEAAAILEPVLTKAERWADLADVLELRLRAQTEPQERSRTLRAVAETAEKRLSDVDRAQGAILRAIAEEPEDAALHAEAERLSEPLGKAGWSRYAETLTDRASNLYDTHVTTSLYARLGRVAEEKLADDARASKAYARAAELGGDSPEILASLDRLYGRLADARALADVLERRIAVEADAKLQAELLHRLASLQIHEFADRSRGLATLRQALERDPRHEGSVKAVEGLLAEEALFDEAFDALEWVHRQLAQSEELATLYGRKVGRAMSVRDRARARLDLARVLEVEVKDAERAQRTIEEALHDDPADIDVLTELERLAAANEGREGWMRASQAFERALGEAKDIPGGTRAELWTRLATWRRDRVQDARGAEEAFVQALAADPENLEVLRAIEALRRAPGRERELVQTLRDRARLETDLPTKHDLLRQAKELADQPLADAALAEAVLRDLLAEDEGDRWALAELVKLREAAGDWKEVAALLLRSAELESGSDMSALQHRAARVITEKLDDAPRAIEIYETILEAEPSDRTASSALRELYVREGRDRDHGRLLELLVETSKDAGERATHRLDLAKIQDEKFGSPRDAAETLRAILEEEPAHEGAVAALSQLFEKTGQFDELAELYVSQVDRARDRGDSAAELALRIRLAETYESKLKDTPRALEAYEAVLEQDPAHRRALEAVARLSEGRGAWERAASALAKLVELGNGADGVADAVRLASARVQLGDVAGVEMALRRALEIQPGNSSVREDLRSLYEREKRWDALAALLVGDADLIAATNPDAPPAPQLPPPQSIAPGRTSVPPAATLPPPPTVGPVADQVRLLRRAAEIHMKERSAPADAVPLLERATGLTPTDRELLLLLCDAYSAASRPRDAASVLEKVIASFGNRRTKELSLYHHRLGRALASLGDTDVAIAQLDMAFKIDPGSVGVLKDLGVLALETNDLDRAQKSFRALLLQRLDPSFGISKGEVFYYLGEISAKQGDKVKAVQMLERAIENEPSLDRAKTRLSELKS